MENERTATRPIWDSLWINVNLATLADPAAGYDELEEAAIAIVGERIAWTGKMEDLPAPPQECAAAVHDGKGRWLTPGLIDCHTHLVFGGNRAAEFEQRLQGVSYEQIARAGGGIRSTLAATRSATLEELVAGAGKRLRFLLAEGVTTVEIKSGYGLEPDTELRMLRAARRLQQCYPVDIRTTFLGAHALPPEYEGRRADFIELICDTMLPAVAEEKLADSVDAFCETIGFTAAETERVFTAAHRLGLPVKLHADQLSDSGGAALAARFNALSADHIEYSSEAGIEAMAAQGTTAVLLPSAFYYLRETRLPPVECLRRHRVPIAIATDANPGSSPTVSLLLIMNMACTLFRLTPAEALAGVTRNAARALGLAADRGTLEVGKRADFVLWDIQAPAELCYWIGVNHCFSVIKNGKPVTPV